MKVKKAAIFSQLEAQFLRECKARNMDVPTPEFAHYVIHVLARDFRIGINWARYNVCAVERYLKNLLEMYADPLDPLMNNFKMKFFYKNYKKLSLKYVQEMYEAEYQENLQHFVHKVLQYPENCNAKQLAQMKDQMVNYIIGAYNIGDLNNYVLREKAHTCLFNVLGKHDLRAYVLKRKYNRKAYLERLGATVCGILIYNFADPNSDRSYMDNILEELLLTRRKVETSFKQAIQESSDYMQKSIHEIDEILTLDFEEAAVRCKWPIEKIRVINKFAALFSTYSYLITQMSKILEHTGYIISTYVQKLNCVSARIKEVLKHRIAADSKHVYPHFKYLAELWKTFKVYKCHLEELQNAKNKMDVYFSEDMKKVFIKFIEFTEERRKCFTETTLVYFSSIKNRPAEKGCNLNLLLPQKDHFKKYCAVTMALTNGMLVLSTKRKKLCADSPLLFGFRNMDYAKYAERNFTELSTNLNSVLFTTASLIIIFSLEDIILQQDFTTTIICECPVCECGKSTEQTQTEFVLENDMSVSNQIETTWNVWDLFRETVHLADIRQRQTHSTQTMLTYGRMGEQNQTYFTRAHFSEESIKNQQS